METLPIELIYEYMLKLDWIDLMNQCQVNKLFREICNSEYFWEQKTMRDFQDYTKDPNKTWREYYTYLIQSRRAEEELQQYSAEWYNLYQEIKQLLERGQMTRKRWMDYYNRVYQLTIIIKDEEYLIQLANIIENCIKYLPKPINSSMRSMFSYIFHIADVQHQKTNYNPY